MKPTPVTSLIGLLLLSAFPLGAAPSPSNPGASTSVEQRSLWPRFRGPNGLGLSDADIPAHWTEADYKWKTKLPGGGHSSPVVWGDRLFLLCGNDHTGALKVVSVSANDGSVLWTREYESETYRHHQYNSYASATPAVDADRVYVCWSNPEELSAAALDHNGKEIWKTALGPFISQHGGGQSPMLFENLVIVTDLQEGPQSFVVALDNQTGNVVWKTPWKPSDKFAAATPCVFRPKTGPAQIIIASKSQGFTALDPHDGHMIWELPDIFDARPVASPYVADGLIFCSCGDGPSGHALVAARAADDGKSATVVWDLHRAVPYVPTSVVKNKLLFYVTDNGVFTCADAHTGKSIWKQRLEGNFFGSLVCARDRIFLLSKEGDAYVIAAKDQFQLLARNPLSFEDAAGQGPPLSTTPAIANGNLYLRTYTHLVCVAGRR